MKYEISNLLWYFWLPVSCCLCFVSYTTLWSPPHRTNTKYSLFTLHVTRFVIACLLFTSFTLSFSFLWHWKKFSAFFINFFIFKSMQKKNILWVCCYYYYLINLLRVVLTFYWFFFVQIKPFYCYMKALIGWVLGVNSINEKHHQDSSNIQ